LLNQLKEVFLPHLWCGFVLRARIAIETNLHRGKWDRNKGQHGNAPDPSNPLIATVWWGGEECVG
jgi:hypothetical protein